MVVYEGEGAGSRGLYLPPPSSQEVPVAGADRWFKLEPRSSASRVQGDCHLVLKLITTQVGSYGEPAPLPAGLRQN